MAEVARKDKLQFYQLLSVSLLIFRPANNSTTRRDLIPRIWGIWDFKRFHIYKDVYLKTNKALNLLIFISLSATEYPRKSRELKWRTCLTVLQNAKFYFGSFAELCEKPNLIVKDEQSQHLISVRVEG